MEQQTHSPSLTSHIGDPAPTLPAPADIDAEKRTNLEEFIKSFKKATQEERTSVPITALLSKQRPPFKQYDGKLVDDCVEFLRALKIIMERCTPSLTKGPMRRLFVKGDPLDEVGRFRISSNPPLLIFFEHFCNRFGTRLVKASKYRAIIDDWCKDVKEGLETQTQRLPIPKPDSHIVGMTEEQRILIEKELVDAECLNDPEFTQKVVDLLKDAQYCKRLGKSNRDHKLLVDTLPFMFVCGPSGSGKTTLAFNLQNNKKVLSPMLYWHFKEVSDEAQDKYKPFQNISSTIMRQIRTDIDTMVDTKVFKRDVESVSSSQLQNTTFLNVELESVHLIVEYYKQLWQLRNEDPELTWAAAQSKVAEIPKGKMSVNHGKEKLKELAVNGFPLTAFIDEASVIGPNLSDLHESIAMVYTRSLLRLLHILPIFAGTEASACNFCGPRTATRQGDLSSYWCCVLNDLPRFNSRVMNEKCDELRKKFACRPDIVGIVDFFQKACTNDNPYLIALAFEFLNASDVHSAPYSGLKVLDQLLHYISSSFIHRKRNGSAYNTGQLNYVFGYTCKGGKCVVNEGLDHCINGHLAWLKGIPSAPGEPHFKLEVKNQVKETASTSTSTSMRHQNVSKTSEDAALCYYKKGAVVYFAPKSYFRHFSEAPLTGLMTFGLNLGRVYIDEELSSFHVPLVNDISSESVYISTTFDALYRAYDSIPPRVRESILKRNPSGAQLEFVYHIAAVIASRANGVTGCPFPMFLSRLVHELSSSAILPAPEVVCPPHFDQTIIPVIAPMNTPAWPEAVVEMLQKMVGDQILHLGKMEPSFGNEPVDSVIYRFKLRDESENVTVDSMDDKGRKPARKIQRVEPEPVSKAPSVKPKPATPYGFREEIDVAPNEKEIILLCECKQYSSEMTVTQIWEEIVYKKFKKHPNCKMNILLTLRVTRTRPEDDSDALDELHKAKYFLWRLQRTRNREGFKVVKYEGQMPYESVMKNVLVIPMASILNFEMMEELGKAWKANFVPELAKSSIKIIR